MEKIQCGQSADYCGDNRGKQNCEGVHVALVKNSENHVHDENGSEQQHRQRTEQLLEHECFALEDTLHGGIIRMELREGVLDELGGVANSNVRQQIEVKSDTSELVEVVDHLGANNFLC